MLILHIIIALSSLGLSAYAVAKPSRSKLQTTYALVALTLLTGVGLVVVNPAHLPQACGSGIVYLCFALTGIGVSRYRLGQLA